VPERDGAKTTVWDLAFSGDGLKIVAGAGRRVLMYDAKSGDLLHSLKSHKDCVYSVDFSADGENFASGGADKTVIIWTKKAEGILKYTHGETIQKVKFNPVTKQLVSCTANDFGLCVPEEKSVSRTKVSARILCCDWTPDGQHLALGMYSGQISIRDQSGQEKTSIKRNGPVWSLAWNPSRAEQVQTLAVGCWDGTLSFYQVNGAQMGRDRRLNFDPCTVSYFDNGNYLLIGGSNRKLTLYSKEGVMLTDVAETDDWCWVGKGCPKEPFVATGSHSGSVSVFKLNFTPINGLYQDRFAFTEGMTDVIVQHLISEQKVRIKCREYVKKVALFKNRLAVQQPDKIVIYELTNIADPFDLRYKVRDKIQQKVECNLLVVTSMHVILCHNSKLQMLDFTGKKEKEWVMESTIRYMKVVGGPPGKEGLLVGLKTGQVLRIFVDNPFPIEIIKHRESIRCLDLNLSRSKLAIVDGKGECVVYDLDSKEKIYSLESAWSVAWNTEQDEMLCISGDGVLSIKTADFPVHQQSMEGIVVGFKGSKIFSLHAHAMETVDVPQSVSLYRFLEAKQYEQAYNVACLGVTESDWRFFGLTALQDMELDVARKAFIRVRDLKFIELVDSIEKARKLEDPKDEKRNLPHLAKIMAYQGHFQEAAKLLAKYRRVDQAVDMFADLRLWEEAKIFAQNSGGVDVQKLIQRQAEWAEESSDPKIAAEMYCAAGQYDKAIEIVGKAGCLDELIDVARNMDRSNVEALKKCAEYLRQYGHHQFAKEVYLKIDDVQSLMKLHVDLHKWEDAFVLSKQHGDKYAEDVYLPYAQWLAERDRFDEAQAAFKKAKQPEKSMLLLKALSQSSIAEQRFNDAAYYLWLLSEENLALAEDSQSGIKKRNEHMRSFELCRSLAEQYFAYATISRYTDEPFSSLEPESVFNAGRFLLNTMPIMAPFGLSRAAVLWAVGKEGEKFGAYKLARHVFDKLGHLRVPNAWRAQINLETMMVQGKPFSDKEEQHFICYRCSTTNPLVNALVGSGDCCVQCAHPFIRSMKSFDLLPLVEFAPEEGMSDEGTYALLRSEPAGVSPEGSHEETKGVDRITFDEPQGSDSSDPFSTFMLDQDFGHSQTDAYEVLRLPEKVLRHVPIHEVFIIRWPGPNKRWQFFKNIMADVVSILKCPQCHSFFHQEDLETACLSNGNHCPLCKSQIEV